MQCFLHTPERIRIVNGDQEWRGTVSEFMVLEPAYPGLPELFPAAVVRYQTPDWQWVQDAAGTLHEDSVNCLGYCEQIASYGGGSVAMPLIDHLDLDHIGTNTHAQLDTHLADTTKHFTQAEIDHVSLLNKGTNTHAQIDTHIANTSIHGGGDGGAVTPYDDVLYEYTDADTITIQAGGIFTLDDGTVCEISTDTVLTLSAGRSTDAGSEAANTLYYVWGGLDGGSLAFYFHTSATSCPGELDGGGRRLRGAVRNDASSNIIPFKIGSHWYSYNVQTICNGSDITEVLDTAVSTSWTDVDCSAFVPIGADLCLIAMITTSSGANHRIRCNGATHGGIATAYTAAGGGYCTYLSKLDAGRIYEVYNDLSRTTRISVIGYLLS